jgi:hypothetical protein
LHLRIGFYQPDSRNLLTDPVWEMGYEETDHISIIFFACSALHDANVEEE